MITAAAKAAIAAGAAVVSYVGYKSVKPVLQGLRGKTSSGAPIQVVVPVTPSTGKNGSSVTPILPGNNASYNSANIGKLLGKLVGGFGNNVNPMTPTVITPGGASNFEVSTNSDVQRALNTLGYAVPPLTVDGKIGPLSETAIKSFQISKGLTPDGQVTSALKLALETALVSMAASNNPIGLNPGVQNAKAPPPQISTIKDVQHALNVLGASPQLTEDGVIGPKTTAAVKAFQALHGLVVDGVPGPQTKTALALAISQM